MAKSTTRAVAVDDELAASQLRQAQELCEHTIEMLKEYEQQPRTWLWRAIGAAMLRLQSTLARLEPRKDES